MLKTIERSFQDRFLLKQVKHWICEILTTIKKIKKHSGNKRTELAIFYCPKPKLSSNIGIFSIKKWEN